VAAVAAAASACDIHVGAMLTAELFTATGDCPARNLTFARFVAAFAVRHK
jgi:hypothetical protein